MKFEWDSAKAESNLKKHGVAFEDAAQVFFDPLAITECDRVVEGEYRWKTLGTVDGCLLLLVAHTIRDESNVEIIRIISARQAEPKERKHYERNNTI